VWLSLRAVLIAVVALGVATGCNGQGAAQPEVADVRDDVLAGARDDFRHTEGVPPEFVDCFMPGLRAALDARSLEWLAAIRAEYGQPAAARALNGFAAHLGDRCGARWHVPQLIGAAGGLG
jgi:hypothetical protein